MKKLPVDELTRLAFVWAEQDRLSLADAWGMDKSPEGREAMSEAAQLRKYRMKRWGRTKGDTLLATGSAVSLASLMRRA